MAQDTPERGVPRTINDPGSTVHRAEDGAPDTLAVAVRHEAGRDAPRVVASGRGWVAEQILTLAFENDVKVREDADLVQVLSAVDPESDIPAEALVAVFNILAYVYQASGNRPVWTEDAPA